MSPMSSMMSAGQIYLLALVVLAAMGGWLGAVFLADRAPGRLPPQAGDPADRASHEDQKDQKDQKDDRLSGARR